MYIGLWNLADDEGIVCADASVIKSELFPFDEKLRVKTIQHWIAQLIEALMIIPLSYQGENYYLIRTFKVHQSINKPMDSKVPLETIQKAITEHSKNTPVVLPAGKEGKGMEWKGKEEAALVFKNPFSDNFLEEWELWKKFKAHQFNFFYKTAISEQAAINELVQLSNGDEAVAQKIIRASIANGWKGFFQLKTENHGSSESLRKPGGQGESIQSAFSKIDSMPD
jgi:hypothetical protein